MSRYIGGGKAPEYIDLSINLSQLSEGMNQRKPFVKDGILYIAIDPKDEAVFEGKNGYYMNLRVYKRDTKSEYGDTHSLKLKTSRKEESSKIVDSEEIPF